jgi:hypothetical protein
VRENVKHSNELRTVHAGAVGGGMYIGAARTTVTDDNATAPTPPPHNHAVGTVRATDHGR